MIRLAILLFFYIMQVSASEPLTSDCKVVEDPMLIKFTGCQDTNLCRIKVKCEKDNASFPVMCPAVLGSSCPSINDCYANGLPVSTASIVKDSYQLNVKDFCPDKTIETKSPKESPKSTRRLHFQNPGTPEAPACGTPSWGHQNS